LSAHAKPKRPDFLLSLPIVVLIGFGMVMVYSASGVQSEQLYNDDSVIFFKQLVALGLGFCAMVVGFMVPHQAYRRKSILYPLMLVVLALLIGVLFQDKANGAARWYYIGRFGFQPSDLAKVVLIFFVSAYGTAVIGTRYLWRNRMLVIFPVLGVFCGLVLAQPDFGTTMILVFIVAIMLFLAGMPLRLLALCGAVLLPMAVGLVFARSYRLQRIMDFIQSEHYQTRQAKLAIGSGGLTGVGLAKGKQKLYYLPEPHTDFIFATLGEEFGFMGTVTVVACFLLMLWRGTLVLIRVKSVYSKVLGGGLLMLICTQAFMNMSIALALFPNKGLTLPFMSAGGTSLIVSMGICGILLNISCDQVYDNRVAV